MVQGKRAALATFAGMIAFNAYKLLRQLVFVFCLLASPASLLVAQEAVVQIHGKLDAACSLDSMRLFVLDGAAMWPVVSVPVTAGPEGGKTFALGVRGLPPGFYMLGSGQPAQTRMLILGTETAVTVKGECATFSQAEVRGSPTNDRFVQAQRRSQALTQAFRQSLNRYQMALRGRGEPAEVEAELAAVDTQRLALLDSLQQNYPFLAKVFGLETYLSYPKHGQDYASEADYFARSYFARADLSDPAYQQVPKVRDAFQNYASTLARLGLPHQVQMAYLDSVIRYIPGDSRTLKLALMGLEQGFRGANEDAQAIVIRTYLKQFPQTPPNILEPMQQQLAAVESRLLGGLAPEIRLPNPQGDTLSLRDLQGKVVLIDFWASWCGPCRKENPRVVKLYERFKPQGLEIYGVSLDNNRDHWVKAIQQDRLPWLHVSDLRKWRSTAAQAYAVHSIPYTVLLDREGRIAAKGLRGEALEQAIQDLLGAD